MPLGAVSRCKWLTQRREVNDRSALQVGIGPVYVGTLRNVGRIWTMLATLENMRALIRLEARILTGHRHDCHELRQPSGFRFRWQN